MVENGGVRGAKEGSDQERGGRGPPQILMRLPIFSSAVASDTTLGLRDNYWSQLAVWVALQPPIESHTDNCWFASHPRQEMRKPFGSEQKTVGEEHYLPLVPF